MTKRILFALAPAALFLTGCDIDDMGSWGSSDRFKEDFHLSYKVQPGSRLAIENFNGGIEIISWEKNEVEVNGTKYCGSAELLGMLKVEGEQTGDTLRLRTVRADGKRSNCGAKYIIRAPKKLQLDGIVSSNGGIRVEQIVGNARLQSSNGSIKVRDLEGRLEAKTSNASIDASAVIGDFTGHTSNGSIIVNDLEGAFEGETSNASIKGRISKLAANRPLKANTSNGSIDLTLPDYKGQQVDLDSSNASVTVHLPANLNADIHATTSNGGISSDFNVNGTQGKNRLDGRVGEGGGTIRLSTSNGGIRIQKL
jgi:DUF4097 and DUF4098 domain-containing protein YvlB